MPSYRTPALEECAEQCLACYRICTKTLADAAFAGDVIVDKTVLGLLEDAADICKAAAAFLLRGSFLHHVTCRACAEVCERCAAQCDALARKHPALRSCADACWSCAEACRRAVTARPSIEITSSIA